MIRLGRKRKYRAKRITSKLAEEENEHSWVGSEKKVSQCHRTTKISFAARCRSTCFLSCRPEETTISEAETLITGLWWIFNWKCLFGNSFRLLLDLNKKSQHSFDWTEQQTAFAAPLGAIRRTEGTDGNCKQFERPGVDLSNWGSCGSCFMENTLRRITRKSATGGKLAGKYKFKGAQLLEKSWIW